MSTPTPPPADPRAEAIGAVKMAAVTTDEGRQIVHCMLGGFGADWDLAKVVELIEGAEAIYWQTDPFAHELAVIANRDSRGAARYQFDVRRPTAKDAAEDYAAVDAYVAGLEDASGIAEVIKAYAQGGGVGSGEPKVDLESLRSLYEEDDANPQWGVAYANHPTRPVLRSSEWDAREEHMSTVGAKLYRRAVTYGPWVSAEEEIHYG